METQTALEKLVASAFAPTAVVLRDPENQSLSGRMKEIDADLARLRTVKASDFLPYEAKAALTLTGEKIKTLETERTGIAQKLKQISADAEQGRVKHEMHVLLAKNGYRDQLDLSLLSMAGKNGPAFLVSPYFNGDGVCQITVKMERKQFRAIFKPALPKAIEALLQNATSDFAERHSESYRQVVVSASFAGSAGKKTADIQAAVEKAQKSGLFSQILVIAEVESWEIKKAVRLQKDPVIAGWVGKTEQLFYITDYNMTPLEQYFKEQYGFGVTIPEEKKKKK